MSLTVNQIYELLTTPSLIELSARIYHEYRMRVPQWAGWFVLAEWVQKEGLFHKQLEEAWEKYSRRLDLTVASAEVARDLSSEFDSVA